MPCQRRTQRPSLHAFVKHPPFQPELCVHWCVGMLARRNLGSNQLSLFPANLLADSMPNVTYL